MLNPFQCAFWYIGEDQPAAKRLVAWSDALLCPGPASALDHPRWDVMVNRMARLTDSLAARRILYARPTPTLPDILVIDVPAAFAHPGLSLGRYYGVMIETVCEQHEFEAFLEVERAALVPPTCWIIARPH